MAKKFGKGEFDFNDLLSQMQQIKKMGGAQSLLKMIPGLGKMASQLENAGMDDKAIKRQEAIITSMTEEERAKPKLLNASRRKRIAAGSGTSVQDVNKLVKQQEQMQLMMKRVKKMGMGKMMGMMKGMMGEGGLESMLGGADLEMLKSMDPDALAADMAGLDTDDPLGSNPFAQGARMPPGLNPFGNGFGGGLPKSLGAITGKKKN